MSFRGRKLSRLCLQECGVGRYATEFEPANVGGQDLALKADQVMLSKHVMSTSFPGDVFRQSHAEHNLKKCQDLSRVRVCDIRIVNGGLSFFGPYF
jgi:hypothetical protein